MTDINQATPDGPNPDYQTVNSASPSQPAVAVPRHALRTAIRLAEQAAEEIVKRIREAEQERDNLARRVGAQQELIDGLNGEGEYRSRHLLDLQAALDA